MCEPNDVTFELDGLGQQLSELPAGDSPAQEADSAQKIGSNAPDGPVFVDSSGRRSKKLRRAGWVVSIACACYAVAVISALVGGDSSAPWLRIPGLAEEERADKVVVQPTPTAGGTISATPGTTDVTPSPTDSNGAVVVRQPSGGGSGGATVKPVTGASSSVKPPNSSADTGSTAGPGGSTPRPGSSSPSGGATGGTGTGGAGGTGGTATTGGTGGGTTDPPSEPSPPPAEPTGPVATTPVQEGGRTMAAEGAR